MNGFYELRIFMILNCMELSEILNFYDANITGMKSNDERTSLSIEESQVFQKRYCKNFALKV